MKRAVIFILAAVFWLSGCGRQTEVPPMPETSSEQFEENVVSIDWDDVFSQGEALDGWSVSGGNGDVFCGYDQSTVAGDGSNFGVIDRHGNVLGPYMFDRLELSGRVLGVGCHDGGLYVLIHETGVDDSVSLILVKDSVMKEVGKVECDPYDSQVSLVTDGRILVTEKKDEYLNGLGSARSSRFTVWQYYAEEGFKKILSEYSEDDLKESESEGLEIIDFGSVGGKLAAIGRGRRNGKYEYLLCTYSEAGELCSSEIVWSIPEDAEPSNIGVATYFMDESDLSAAVIGYNEKYSISARQWGLVNVYNRETHLSVRVKLQAPEDCYLSRIISVGDGFLAEFEDDDGMLKHSPIIKNSEIEERLELLGS